MAPKKFLDGNGVAQIDFFRLGKDFGWIKKTKIIPTALINRLNRRWVRIEKRGNPFDNKDKEWDKEVWGLFEKCKKVFEEIFKGWQFEEITDIKVLFDKKQSFIMYHGGGAGSICNTIYNPDLWLGFSEGVLIASGIDFDLSRDFDNFVDKQKEQIVSQKLKNWIWPLCRVISERSVRYLGREGDAPGSHGDDISTLGGGKNTFNLIETE